MNLTKLFEMQKVLDERIEKEHPRQEGEDRLAKKILALQVELGELANEWRGFKFWSKNQEANKQQINYPYQKGKEFHGPTMVITNPLLEEYVDCLHFILSIGNEIGATEFLQNENDWSYMNVDNIITNFGYLFSIEWKLTDDGGYFTDDYYGGFEYFMTLGKTLGFTWEQIEQAYISKNEVNHERQATNY